MKKISILFMSLIGFMPLQADEWCCEPSFYGKIWSGANFLESTSNLGNHASYETGYLISGSFGYRFCSDFRVEAEYAYRRNAINKIRFFTEGNSKRGHFQTSSFMANLFWDTPLCGEFEGFLGAGIGYDYQQMHSSNDRVVFDQKWHHFAWQLMAGLSYEVFCNTDIVVEYNYHQGGCNFQNHAIGLGIVYSFDCF